jgi:hypothetical protein
MNVGMLKEEGNHTYIPSLLCKECFSKFWSKSLNEKAGEFDLKGDKILVRIAKVYAAA